MFFSFSLILLVDFQKILISLQILRTRVSHSRKLEKERIFLKNFIRKVQKSRKERPISNEKSRNVHAVSITCVRTQKFGRNVTRDSDIRTCVSREYAGKCKRKRKRERGRKVRKKYILVSKVCTPVVTHEHYTRWRVLHRISNEHSIMAREFSLVSKCRKKWRNQILRSKFYLEV